MLFHCFLQRRISRNPEFRGDNQTECWQTDVHSSRLPGLRAVPGESDRSFGRRRIDVRIFKTSHIKYINPRSLEGGGVELTFSLSIFLALKFCYLTDGTTVQFVTHLLTLIR